MKHQRPHELDRSATVLLENYNWPGNIRELRYFIERLVIITKEFHINDTILEKYWDDHTDICENSDFVKSTTPIPERSEKETIIQAIADSHANISKAANQLSMDRSTLYRKLKTYKIEIKKRYT